MKKHRIALNRNFILLLIGGLLLALIVGDFFAEGEIGLGVSLAFFALLLIAAPVIAMPWCYCFDPEGVSAKYIFFPQERYLWENIYWIHVVDAIAEGRHSLFFYDFKIEGDVEGKQRLYMDGRICKTRRTKRLIEEYWDGTIEGYWHDEVQAVKKWWHKRTKKQQQPKQYLTDEVVRMEREARASVREWIAPFAAEARQYDLQVHTQYAYVTEDLEQHRSRPQAAYTYTAALRICRPGETIDDRMIILEADLLHVRIGKKAYRGVVNSQAKEDLTEYFSETMTQIKKEGFDACIKYN